MTNKTRIILFTGLVVAAGCVFVASKHFKSVEDTFKDDIKARYGENVEFVKMDEDSSNEDTRVATLRGKEDEFQCVKYYDLNGDAHFKDNYLGVKFKEEIQGMINNELPEGCTAEVDLEKSVFGELEDPVNTTLDSLLEMPTSYIYVNITSESEWSDESVVAFCESLKGKVKTTGVISWGDRCYHYSVNPDGDVVDTSITNAAGEPIDTTKAEQVSEE